jgi:ubiquitin-protein ligase E3 C
LPSRLPLTPLKELSSHLPLSSTHLLSPYAFVGSLSNEAKAHLIANLVMFTPPRYPTFQPKELDTYLLLLASVLHTLPPNALEPPSTSKDKSWVDEGDSDDEAIRVEVVSTFTVFPMPRLDPKTLKRTPKSPFPHAYIYATWSLFQQRQGRAFHFLLGYMSGLASEARQGSRDHWGHTGGGFVRELYREHVRSSPLGAEVDAFALAGDFKPCILVGFILTFGADTKNA